MLSLTTLPFCNFILLVFCIFFASPSGFLLLGMTEDRGRSVSAPVLGTVSKQDATLTLSSLLTLVFSFPFPSPYEILILAGPSRLNSLHAVLK